MNVPLLEDAGAIQIALGQVIDAIASARIDHRTASLLLYALQIGAQVTPRRNDDDDRATVREVCSQQDGELIAPETALCDPGIDCDKCPSKHKCVSLRRASYRTMKKLLTSLNRQHDKWDEQNSNADVRRSSKTTGLSH